MAAAYSPSGKVALITGAARGIGFETARQLHAKGASVAVLDLDRDDARRAAMRSASARLRSPPMSPTPPRCGWP